MHYKKITSKTEDYPLPVQINQLIQSMEKLSKNLMLNLLSVSTQLSSWNQLLNPLLLLNNLQFLIPNLQY